MDAAIFNYRLLPFITDAAVFYYRPLPSINPSLDNVYMHDVLSVMDGNIIAYYINNINVACFVSI